MKTETVIIGGGLTGILCALCLSNKRPESKIVLIDSHDTLGGRFFFSSEKNGAKSGPGFENNPIVYLDTLKRHLFLYLTEDEKSFLDSYLQEKMSHCLLKNFRPKKHFIKKQAIQSNYILLANSEFLTKKDAENLNALAHFHKNQHFSKESDILLQHSEIWKSFGKTTQENLLPILKCVVGKSVLKEKVRYINTILQEAFFDSNHYLDPFFFRTSEIELALEKILKERNTEVFTNCTVHALEETPSHESQNGSYVLTLNHMTNQLEEFSNSTQNNAKIFTQNIVFTIPPYQIRHLIQKEHFSSELARFVSKIQPTSFVCLEIQNFKSKLNDLIENQINEMDTLYFPIEGAAGYLTSNQCMHLFIELDYETSLQAPAVRESITYLRRAARRVLKQEFAEELKKGAFIRKMDSFEKIILLPIAKNIPNDTQEMLSELKDVTFQKKNVFAAGDYFHSLGETEWKRMIKSIELVSQLISPII